MTTRADSAIRDDMPQPADKGTGFLFWGWIIVTLLNLGMVSVSVFIFGP